jgi:ethanolamine utilization protein EutN
MFRLAAPLSLDELLGKPAAGEAIVVYDELNAGEGQLIGISEGREAAQPFEPDVKPIDAYNAAILDHVDVRPRRANQNK